VSGERAIISPRLAGRFHGLAGLHVPFLDAGAGRVKVGAIWRKPRVWTDNRSPSSGRSRVGRGPAPGSDHRRRRGTAGLLRQTRQSSRRAYRQSYVLAHTSTAEMTSLLRVNCAIHDGYNVNLNAEDRKIDRSAGNRRIVPAIPPPTFFLRRSTVLRVYSSGRGWFTRAPAGPRLRLNCATYCATGMPRMGCVVISWCSFTYLGGVASMGRCSPFMVRSGRTAIKHRTLAVAWLGIMIARSNSKQGCKEVFRRSRAAPDLRRRRPSGKPSYPRPQHGGAPSASGCSGYALVLPATASAAPHRRVNLMIAVVPGDGFSRIICAPLVQRRGRRFPSAPPAVRASASSNAVVCGSAKAPINRE